MIDLLFTNPLIFLIVFPSLLVSIALHEYAHCWVADRLGDPTPRLQGRLTLDPRAHLDSLGVLMILFTRFGWGKSAPYDPYNLREPVRDTALIAGAGPLTNLIIAGIGAILFKLFALLGWGWWSWTTIVLIQIVFINVALAMFNLLPVTPLDGSKIITAFLPQQTAEEYQDFMNRYGLFVLIFLLMPWGGRSPVSALLSPLINLVMAILI